MKKKEKKTKKEKFPAKIDPGAKINTPDASYSSGSWHFCAKLAEILGVFCCVISEKKGKIYIYLLCVCAGLG